MIVCLRVPVIDSVQGAAHHDELESCVTLKRGSKANEAGL